MGMKLIVISDSHGKIELVQQILEAHADADAFLHCGDLEVPSAYFPQLIAVRGNNDYYGGSPDERVVSVGNWKVLMTHSHQYSIMSRYQQLRKKAARLGCKLVCFGHTHIYHESFEDGIYLLNPGSCAYPRDGADPCYAIVTDKGDQLDIERVFIPRISR